jgi:hypothetical protein
VLDSFVSSGVLERSSGGVNHVFSFLADVEVLVFHERLETLLGGGFELRCDEVLKGLSRDSLVIFVFLVLTRLDGKFLFHFHILLLGLFGLHGGGSGHHDIRLGALGLQDGEVELLSVRGGAGVSHLEVILVFDDGPGAIDILVLNIASNNATGFGNSLDSRLEVSVGERSLNLFSGSSCLEGNFDIETRELVHVGLVVKHRSVKEVVG